MTRVAAIDCGTNSIRLLVADIDVTGTTLTDVVRTMQIVRLGEGVDRTGVLSEGALERTFAACDQYARAIAEAGVQRTRFVATSATRDAANRQVFFDGVRQRLGVEPQVISGDTEARLSFIGSTRALGDRITAEPVLVVDIGGGSTEFVLGRVSGEVLAAHSVDVGCVRMTERRLRSDPPTSDEIDAATADIDAAIARAGEEVELAAAQTLVGLAGSVTTLSAIAMDLDRYDADATHGSWLSRADVETLTGQLLRQTHEQRAAIPVMHPGRVDVIGGGALVLDRILAATGLPAVLVSEHDILDGIAWSLVED
ncbi:MAG: Ppx/GppA phosphatase family protein [Candidatus Nanopelagicales bacterium]|nr:Ppx/GppA family phosphatase [Candidatus Nanopelagicales bacterium]